MEEKKRPQYGAITFPEHYDGTIEQFIAEFENTWVFKQMEPKERLRELKKAFAIATNKKDTEKPAVTK